MDSLWSKSEYLGFFRNFHYHSSVTPYFAPITNQATALQNGELLWLDNALKKDTISKCKTARDLSNWWFLCLDKIS